MLQTKFLLFFSLTLWAVFFAAKGAFFQIGLYIFPFFIMLISQYRKVLLTVLRKDGIKLVGMLIVPGLITVTAFLSQGKPFDVESAYDLFDVFWRIIVFPAAIATYFYINKPMRSWIIPGLIFISLLYALGGCAQLVNHRDILKFSGRISGFIKNYNGFGFIMGSGILLFLGVLPELTLSSIWQRTLLIAAPILCIPCLILSGSRGSWLSTILAICVLVLLNFKQIKISQFKILYFIGAITIFFACFLLLMNSPYLVSRVSHIFSDPIRIAIWNYYLSLLDGHWILGLSGYYQQLYLSPKGVYFGPHNIYLDTLIRCGALGLAGWLFCFGWIVVRIRKNSWDRCGKLALGGLTMVLAAGFVDYSLYCDPILQAPLAMVTAVAYSKDNLRQSSF